MPEIKSVFFDLDGVIIPERIGGVNAHITAISMALGHYKYRGEIDWDVGESSIDIFNDCIGDPRLAHSFLEKKDEYFASQFPLWCPENSDRVCAIFTSLKISGIKFAVVTNNRYQAARKVLDLICRDYQLQHGKVKVFARDTVKHTKPHPALYRAAMEWANCGWRDALAIDDSYKGVEAARLAGCRTWMPSSCEEVTRDAVLDRMERLRVTI